MNMEVGTEYIRLSELNGRRCDAVMFDYNVVINETEAGNYIFSRQPDVNGWSDFRFDLTAQNVVDVNNTYGYDVFYDHDVNDVYGDFVLVDNGVVSWGWSEPVYYYGFEGSQSAAENIWVRVVEEGGEEEPDTPDNPDTPVDPDEPEYDGPTIADNLQRIITAKADIKVAIENKGVYVGDVTIDEYASKIDEISSSDSKIKLYNGISFQGSTFETMDWDRYDWSDVYDGRKLFYNCSNLREVPFYLLSNIIDATSMCSYCTNLNVIEGVDMTNLKSHDSMFHNTPITDVFNCIFKTIDNQSVISSRNAIYEGCDFSQVKNFNAFKGSFAKIDGLHPELTKITDCISNLILDCARPENLTTLNVSSFAYRAGMGWDDFANSSPSNYEMGINFTIHGANDDTFVLYRNTPSMSNREFEDAFENWGDGHFYLDYGHSYMGRLTIFHNGEEFVFPRYAYLKNKSYRTSPSSDSIYLGDYEFWAPQHVEGTLAGENILNAIYYFNDSWVYDAEKNAVKSGYHKDGFNEDIFINTGGYGQMTINYGQSTEKGYDYLIILTPDETELANAKYMEGNALEITVECAGYPYLIFRYRKDSGGSNGEDCVWINEIRYN
jgi:hypothetical protein